MPSTSFIDLSKNILFGQKYFESFPGTQIFKRHFPHFTDKAPNSGMLNKRKEKLVLI